MPGYMRPVAPTNGRISSWGAHTRRNPPSKEPGVDYYCPIGTPVHGAGDGVVVAVGNSITPATGRWFAVDLDDGRSYRDMHLSHNPMRVGQRVSTAPTGALSGASGYGKEDWSRDPNTGGAHVHRTLFDRPWRYASQTIGRTLDPELYSTATPGSSAAGIGAKPFDPVSILEASMSNPIVNVIEKYGVDKSTGTVYIGRDDGTFEVYGPPYANNIRGILSVAFFGGTDGGKDLIPTVSLDDFAAVRGVWATMCAGGVDAAAVWSHPIQAQDAHGLPLADAEGRPIKFSAEGYLASTNALVTGIDNGATVDVAALADQLNDALGAELAETLITELGKRLTRPTA